jgi:hypothetical protein
MALQFRQAVTADCEGEMPARRCQQGDAQIVGERLATVALRPRQFLRLIDADQDGCGAAASGLAQPSPFGLQRRLQGAKPLRRQAAVRPTRGLAPRLVQAAS